MRDERYLHRAVWLNTPVVAWGGVGSTNLRIVFAFDIHNDSVFPVTIDPGTITGRLMIGGQRTVAPLELERPVSISIHPRASLRVRFRQEITDLIASDLRALSGEPVLFDFSDIRITVTSSFPEDGSSGPNGRLAFPKRLVEKVGGTI